VVEFEPQKQEDERKAQSATDYCNYLYFRVNNGHRITYTAFKDSLLQKVGIVKVWWDDRNEETREEYRAQTPVNLAMLSDDPEIEITEQKAYPDEDDADQRTKALEQLSQQLQQAMSDPRGAQAVPQIQQRIQQIQAQPPAMLYDVTCKRTRKQGKVCIENVPPEEFLISRTAKTIQDATFVGHRVLRSMSDLRSQGYKNVDNLSDDTSDSLEATERQSWDDDYPNSTGDTSDESQKKVWITECYIRCDYGGDKISELRKVVKCGREILENEIVDITPFVAFVPIPLPHRFFGLSVADLGFATQLVKTSLLRATIDNVGLEVNGRYFAVDGQVNLDDLLTSRPGGVVRVKSAGAVGRLDQGKGGMQEAMGLLEYMHSFGEDAMGWSRNSSGTDPQALNQTATATTIVTNKADMRLDLIARNLSEGFVDLFRMILKFVSQYQHKATSIRLSGQWTEMDPREWRNMFDVSINVGLGVGNKDQQLAHLQVLQNAQVHGMQIGIATPDNLYSSSTEMAKLMGFKNGDKFFTQPSGQKPPDPAQGQMQMEQMRAQLKAQTDLQMKQADMQLERERMQMQAQVDSHRQTVEAEQQSQRIAQEMQLEREKAMLQAQLEREKAQLQGDVQLRIAQINAESRLDAAQVSAQSILTQQQEEASDLAVDGGAHGDD
jgi:hypothetical protein